jgi:cytochrome b pre-mRNA-processing protein 3
LGAILIAVSAFWIWNRGVESRSLNELAVPERHALYQRTLQTLQSSACDPNHGAHGLHDYCRRQAEFIVEFPECDASCSALAKRLLLNPEK